MDSSERSEGRGRCGSATRGCGVWEVRVVVTNDPVSDRSLQRSFAVHGDAEQVEERDAPAVVRQRDDAGPAEGPRRTRDWLHLRRAPRSAAQLLVGQAPGVSRHERSLETVGLRTGAVTRAATHCGLTCAGKTYVLINCRSPLKGHPCRT